MRPQEARRKSSAKSGRAIGSPAKGCPGGTISVSLAHAARAPTGSSKGVWVTGAAEAAAAFRSTVFLRR